MLPLPVYSLPRIAIFTPKTAFSQKTGFFETMSPPTAGISLRNPFLLRSPSQPAQPIDSRNRASGGENPPDPPPGMGGAPGTPSPDSTAHRFAWDCRPVLERQGLHPKKERALFWVPALTLSAPVGCLRLPMGGSAGEGGKPVRVSPAEFRPATAANQNRSLPSSRSARIAFGKPGRQRRKSRAPKPPRPGRRDRFPNPAQSPFAFTFFGLFAPLRSESGSPPNPTAPAPALPRLSPPGRTPTKS